MFYKFINFINHHIFRKLKNRQSAQISRDKRKDQLKSIEIQNEKLLQEKAEYISEIDRLRHENDRLSRLAMNVVSLQQENNVLRSIVDGNAKHGGEKSAVLPKSPQSVSSLLVFALLTINCRHHHPLFADPTPLLTVKRLDNVACIIRAVRRAKATMKIRLQLQQKLHIHEPPLFPHR